MRGEFRNLERSRGQNRTVRIQDSLQEGVCTRQPAMNLTLRQGLENPHQVQDWPPDFR